MVFCKCMEAITTARKKYFSHSLMRWHEQSNNRSLPWKQEQNPYRIWLSEIILQQTRAEQGLPYYLKFIEAYPTITDLAKAKDEDVFRLWQGLGYYNRCKNLLATARFIAGECKGIFPSTHEAIISLKGVGAYTAAAIASFAYGLPLAVVDGNVTRVLARYFGMEIPLDSTEGKKLFQSLAQELLVKQESAAYNQAIMDLGATVCKPRQPLCAACPLSKNCFAYQHDIMESLPVKSKKLIVKTRYFNYLFLTYEGKTWLRKRVMKDIWQNLYEPLLIESDKDMAIDALRKEALLKPFNTEGLRYKDVSSQRLTHQIIKAKFYTLELQHLNVELPDGGAWVAIDNIRHYAFPKTLVSFLEKYSILLEY